MDASVLCSGHPFFMQSEPFFIIILHYYKALAETVGFFLP